MILFQQVLLACLSIFVIALTVAVVYSIFILRDIGKSVNAVNMMVSDARKKFNALTSVLDFVGTFIGGVDSAKKKIKKKMIKQIMPSKAVMLGFFAGVKKGIQILTGGEKE